MQLTQGSLLNQLAIANESLGRGVVVVMAERDKEDMENDIAKMEFDFKGTTVICRSGSPLILSDLKKVTIHICPLVHLKLFLTWTERRIQLMMQSDKLLHYATNLSTFLRYAG